MANYQFSKNNILKPEKELWKIALNDLKKKKSVFSIKDKEYKIISVSNLEFGYQAQSRNGGTPESIFKDDFIEFVKSLKKIKIFNTSNKEGVVTGALYRKRSPVFAVLLAAKIIEEI